MHDMTIVARFWSKVDVQGDHECWRWRGAIGGGGKTNKYGRFRTRSGVQNAHRVAWEIANGAPLRDRFACHTCDNTLCVNPAHLYAGDHESNTRDAVARNRLRPSDQAGARNGNAKLTAEDVSAIRELLAQGATNVAIANRFPISHAMVSRIRTGRSWASI